AGKGFGDQLEPVAIREIPQEANLLAFGRQSLSEGGRGPRRSVDGSCARELAAARLAHRGAGDLKANRGTFGRRRRETIDESFLAAGEPRGAAAAPGDARDENGIFDEARREFARPGHSGFGDTVAVQSDRAILADPLL